MGVEYYLITKNKKDKKALSVWIGKGYSTEIDHNNIKTFANIIADIGDVLFNENLEDIMNTELSDITVGQLYGLVRIKELLSRIIMLDISPSGELLPILSVLGLIWKLTEGGNSEFEWEIVDDINLDEILETLKGEGYKVVEWN